MINFLGNFGITWSVQVDKQSHSTQPFMARYSGKISIRHPKVWWKAGRWFQEPCYDLPSMVFLELLDGWLCSFKALQVHTDRHGCKVVHWTSTTFVCGFWLSGNYFSYALSATHSLWNGYGYFDFTPLEYLHAHIGPYPWVEKAETTH